MEIKLKNKKPDIRYLNDMGSVVYDKEWAKTAPDLELYYMYRGVEKKGELRYDITEVPAKMLGSEFVKTKGHYHVGNYQELYMVLEGEAIFLMQKRNGEIIEDVYAVKTKKGQAIIVPPGYGHVTINPSKENLKMANWISENCKSDYSDYEKLQGACYYYTQAGPASAKGLGETKWLKNENYKQIPELRFEEPFNSVPENLDFLK